MTQILKAEDLAENDIIVTINNVEKKEQTFQI